jgi:hypothetical protein
MVRAKFQVTSIASVAWSPSMKVVKLSAVSTDETPENQRFHKYTPSGTIEISIDNPPAAEQFILGQSLYVDFSPAP